MSAVLSQDEALTDADLVKRWRVQGEGRCLVDNLRRMREKLGLRPFYGKGASARYRPADVIRAEERGAR